MDLCVDLFLNVCLFTDGTALHIAAEKNMVELAKRLLDYGADCNSINRKTGRTPLHVAVINKHAAIVSLLLKQVYSPLDSCIYY